MKKSKTIKIAVDSEPATIVAIVNKYGTLKQYCNNIGIPFTTIHTMLHRTFGYTAATSDSISSKGVIRLSKLIDDGFSQELAQDGWDVDTLNRRYQKYKTTTQASYLSHTVIKKTLIDDLNKAADAWYELHKDPHSELTFQLFWTDDVQGTIGLIFLFEGQRDYNLASEQYNFILKYLSSIFSTQLEGCSVLVFID